MKATVYESDFLDAFRRIRPDQFSRDALVALYQYYEEMERDTGEEMELDVIAICCDWSEFDSALSAAEEYGFTPEPGDPDEQEAAAMEWLRGKTTVLELDNTGCVVLGF